MSKTLLINIVRFLGLLILQIFLFDQIYFLGFINPMVYLLFIILFPVNNKTWDFMLLAFLLGIVLDTFQDTGGAHAAACLTLAFTRPLWLQVVYGESYKMKNLTIIKTSPYKLFLYLMICITLHHVVFFNLVIFNTSQLFYVLKLTVSIALASLLINGLLLMLFKPRLDK
jgi:rod shape-determining protein MreD